MFGLLILIYVSEKVPANCLSEIFTAEVPTGIMGTVGNKGSIGVSFKVNETRICFVCSHFASDTDQLQKRNADYRSTKQRMKFEYNANLDYYDLDNHDMVFWFGDLNYRLEKISLSQTMDMIYTNQVDKLVGFDQLTLEMGRFNVFDDYNEGKINFRPTYKYVVGEDIHEMQVIHKAALDTNDQVSQNNHNNSLVKFKLPSWTDRILWKTQNSKISQVSYSCINTITISDHKPVYALFDVECRKIDEKKFNRIYDNLLKDSDKKVNAEMPKISIDKYFCRFQNCRFYDQKTEHLDILNEGVTKSNIDVQFYDNNLASEANATSSFESDLSVELIDQNRRSLQHKLSQWCSLNPQHKERVEPQTSYKIEVTTNFNQHHLQRFNRDTNVDDFLIIRCLNGNDIFVTLTCEFIPTIIGFSLKTLSALATETLSLTEPEQKLLIQSHEQKITKFEQNLNSMWLHSLKSLSTLLQTEAAQKQQPTNTKTKFFTESNSEQTFEDIFESKILLHRTLLFNLEKELKDKDEFFNSPLSPEWTFLLQHLIDRCQQNNILDSKNRSSMMIEDQKNSILSLLTERNFEKFRTENFDLELLVEVLYDLLYALPSPIIPSRFFDVFIYTANKYTEALHVFNFIPRAHFTCFEMLIKFLQIYSKGPNSGLNKLISNAIFKINPNKPESMDVHKSQTANKLVTLFIENHPRNV